MGKQESTYFEMGKQETELVNFVEDLFDYCVRNFSISQSL